MQGKPVLMIKMQGLGWGASAAPTARAYQDLMVKLDEWFSGQQIYCDGYRCKTVELSLCEQYDNLHCVIRESQILRGKD